MYHYNTAASVCFYFHIRRIVKFNRRVSDQKPIMANFLPFHTQVTSIMGVFVDAAVAQICELVDEGYAVLRLEISRSQKENEELKEKLVRMEMGNMLGLGNVAPAVHERTPFYAISGIRLTNLSTHWLVCYFSLFTMVNQHM